MECHSLIVGGATKERGVLHSVVTSDGAAPQQCELRAGVVEVVAADGVRAESQPVLTRWITVRDHHK